MNGNNVFWKTLNVLLTLGLPVLGWLCIQVIDIKSSMAESRANNNQAHREISEAKQDREKIKEDLNQAVTDIAVVKDRSQRQLKLLEEINRKINRGSAND